MFNLPDGCLSTDPRLNEEDDPWVKCHICGDGGYIEHNERYGYSCTCKTCDAGVFNIVGGMTCINLFKDGYYTNVTNCQNCNAETTGLKIYTDIFGKRLACCCGVSGPYKKTETEAVAAWNELF